MTEIHTNEQTQTRVHTALADALGVGLITRLGHLAFPETVTGRLSILIFHRVLAEPDPLLPEEITAQQFSQDIKILAERFNVMSLSDGLRGLREGTLPPFALCLTFDDGYRDNVTIALPILQRFGLTATFFIATGYLDGGRMWNDTLLEIMRRWPGDRIDLTDWGVPIFNMETIQERRKNWKMLFRWMKRIGVAGRSEMLDRLTSQLNEPLPTDLMLSSDQVTELARAGMEIGCHTQSHPIFTRIDDRQVRSEITVSRNQLESLSQSPIRYFAYPNGIPGDDYNQRHVDIIRQCGFEAAFSTAWGVATAESDLYQLPRFTPWDKSSARFALRFLLSRRNLSYQTTA
jgi:peptidoglycan/xylan/chitin deacetylase (PgdA/CDA1 family)